jgi:hypothetical protein
MGTGVDTRVPAQDVEAELPEPDEERVEFLRQRWQHQDTQAHLGFS